MDAAPPPESPGLQLTLTVWADPAAPWHARAVLADATTLEFENPFELARFLSWPGPPAPRPGGGGLR